MMMHQSFQHNSFQGTNIQISGLNRGEHYAFLTDQERTVPVVNRRLLVFDPFPAKQDVILYQMSKARNPPDRVHGKPRLVLNTRTKPALSRQQPDVLQTASSRSMNCLASVTWKQAVFPSHSVKQTFTRKASLRRQDMPDSSCAFAWFAKKSRQALMFVAVLLLLILSCSPDLAASAQKWPAACDNLEIDPQALKQARAAGHSLNEYRFGAHSSEGPLYISRILSQDAPGFNLEVPDDAGLYGRKAGSAIPYTLLVCYPAASDNPYPDYLFPESGLNIPAMRPAGGGYYFPARQKFPLVLISHGLLMDPLDRRIFELARSGYVAAALFHGDGRFSFPSLLDLSRIEQFSLRPLSISAAIDYMLEIHPAKEIIDPVRIGGVGVSIGGLAVFSLTGARIIGPDFFSTRQTAVDPRISAAAGIVPFMGPRGIPFPVLGTGARGAGQAHVPYMAVSALFDPVADIQAVEKALARKPGDAYLVSLDTDRHYISDSAIDLSFDWILAYLDSYLKGSARQQNLFTLGTSLDSSVGNSLSMARRDQQDYINETFDAVQTLFPELLPPQPTLHLDEISYRAYGNSRYLAVYANELYWINQGQAAALGPLMYWWNMLAGS